jgi:hypothetical protein
MWFLSALSAVSAFSALYGTVVPRRPMNSR